MKAFRLFSWTLTTLFVLSTTATGTMDVLARGRSSVPPIEIIRLDELRFGTMAVSPATGGAVSVDPDAGVPLATGGAIPLGGLTGPATFELRGAPGARFAVHLPIELEIHGSAGGRAFLRQFRSIPSDMGMFDTLGRAIIRVGATLEVSSFSTRGQYSTQLDLIVEYVGEMPEPETEPEGIEKP